MARHASMNPEGYKEDPWPRPKSRKTRMIPLV
ncbi:uncharacterized protein G2W53_027634 [Senna tora]|uniref:Uncharacterized protein n=1 Tax=Senna tora TaxID=362788 RepID=A0A834TR42_9FABA|nr:uncharacterized protein G2W53_027634 [Senna tora]